MPHWLVEEARPAHHHTGSDYSLPWVCVVNGPLYALKPKASAQEECFVFTHKEAPVHTLCNVIYQFFLFIFSVENRGERKTRRENGQEGLCFSIQK